MGIFIKKARENESLVNIQEICPSIKVEILYSTRKNFCKKKIYKSKKALIRKAVAQKLALAQSLLKNEGFGLKIWDGYRSKEDHLKLYNLAKENEKKFFAEPFNGTGSLHSHGCAVDVTLIDLKGKNVRMPTDFDTFTDEASVDYKGGDKIVEYNLIALQRAMQESGFFWLTLNWHYFVANNFEEYSII